MGRWSKGRKEELKTMPCSVSVSGVAVPGAMPTCPGPAGETCIMRMTQEASMSISVDSCVSCCRCCWRNRRAGPLDESGISSSACGCVYVYAYRMYPCLKFVSVCWLVHTFLLSLLLFSDPTPGTEHQHTGKWTLAAASTRRGPAASEDRQAPGTSRQARCFSIFRSPLFPTSSFVLLAPAADAHVV